MKFTLDNSPAKLEIVTPMGNITIDHFPDKMTRILVIEPDGFKGYCARGDHQTMIDITPRTTSS